MGESEATGRGAKPERRFGLGDLAILVAGLALLMAAGRGYPAELWGRLTEWRDLFGYFVLGDRDFPEGFRGHPLPMIRRHVAAWLWIMTTAGLWYVLFSATPAILWIRLRSPRPPLWRLARQPGFAASAAAAFGFWLHLAASQSVMWPQRERVTVGVAVASAWAAQWASHRRDAVPGWIDRAGRLLGWGWIALAAATASENLWLWRQS